MTDVATTTSSLVPSYQLSNDLLRDAVKQVFAAVRMDFGAQFKDAVPTPREGNAWQWRLYKKLEGTPPDVVIDGYDRAVFNRRPYMPTLIDIVEGVRTVAGERQRAAEAIEVASTPHFDGLAGYVDHVLDGNATTEWAKKHIGLIREFLARQQEATCDERKSRAEAAKVDHDEIMAKAPPVRSRGQYMQCAVVGCHAPGTHTHSLGAPGATWFCVKHWRAR